MSTRPTKNCVPNLVAGGQRRIVVELPAPKLLIHPDKQPNHPNPTNHPKPKPAQRDPAKLYLPVHQDAWKPSRVNTVSQTTMIKHQVILKVT